MRLAVSGLVAIAAAIAAIQFAASKTGFQSTWKGGGFGMYTEPHVIKNVVWLVLETPDGDHAVRLWPRDPEAPRSLAAADRPILEEMIKKALLLVTSGDAALTGDIEKLAANVQWIPGFGGSSSTESTATLNPVGMRIERYELRFDMSNRAMTARPIDG